MRNIFQLLPLLVLLCACGSSGGGRSLMDLSQIEGATDVPVDSSFQYSFSSAVDMDTVAAGTFYILPTPLAGASISKAAFHETNCDADLGLNATTSCESGTRCTLDPSSSLSPGTSYTVCLASDISHQSGDAFEGFSTAFTTASPADACGISLLYAGPTAASQFSGLGEDAARCLMGSWREAFVERAPDSTMIFVSSECGQSGDGSLDRPYCDIAKALVRAAEMAGREVVPELYVDPGEHSMNLSLRSALPSLKIRGLCSTTTTISPSDSDTPLIRDDESVSVTLRIQGVTLVGGESPVISISNGNAALEDVHVVQNLDNACFFLGSANASMSVSSVEMEGGATIAPIPTSSSSGLPKATLPVVDGRDVPRCIVVQSGASLILEDFYLHDFAGVAIHVTGAGSQATLTSGIVSNIAPLYESALWGYGIAVEDGASLEATDVTLTGNYGTNLLADGDGTAVTIRNSYIGQAKSNFIPGSGVGLIIQDRAQGVIQSVSVEDSDEPGIYLSNSSSTTVQGSHIIGNGFSGIALVDAEAQIIGNVIDANQSSPSNGGGVGIYVQGLSDDVTVSALVSNNVISNNVVGSYITEKADGDMSLTFEGNLFSQNGPSNPWVPGFHLYDVESGVELDHNCFDSQSGGKEVFLHAANALLDDNIYQGIYSDYVIQQQQCGGLTSPPVLPYQIPVDISGEIFVSLAPSCLCGVDTSTGSPCNSIPSGPLLYHIFTIEEVELLN